MGKITKHQTLLAQRREIRKEINDLIYNTSKKCQVEIRLIWRWCVDDINKSCNFDLERLYQNSAGHFNKLDILQLHCMLEIFRDIVILRCKQIETDFYRTSKYPRR